MKCGACGRFIAANEAVKCRKCPGYYHRACVNFSASATIPPTWICPGCKIKLPREHNTHTPVKGEEANVTAMSTQPETQPGPKLSGGCVPEPQELIDLAKEMRYLRNEVAALRTEIRDFREEMADLKESVKECSDRVDSLESRVTTIEEKFERVESRNETGCVESLRLQELESTIEELKQQLNEREQESIQNDIQLSGITKAQGENPNQILHTLAVKLGVELDARDVVFAKRVGNVLRDRTEGVTPRPRVIAIRLARRATRDSLLAAARVRRGLTTADIQMPGAAHRIFINERLTKFNRQLFYLTRQAAGRSEWKYAWTKDGRILARKEEGKPNIHIRTVADVKRIFGCQ